jgi:nuclear polyadenylated RNA-binding protein NAB2
LGSVQQTPHATPHFTSFQPGEDLDINNFHHTVQSHFHTLPIANSSSEKRRDHKMAVELALETPLAEALQAAIRPKLVEVGWATDGGGDDSTLSEYIILMLVNGKSQDDIASELAGDLLGLSPDDPGAKQFVIWLFEQIESLNAQINGQTIPSTTFNSATQDTGNAMDHDMDAGASVDAADFNAYV